MRKYSSVSLSLVLFAVAALVLCPGSSYAVSHSIGYRLWMADWSSLDSDLGSSQLHMIYYGMNFEKWGALMLGGTGSGWEGESSRLDIQGAVTRRINAEWATVRLGAGYHYIDFSFDNFSGFGGSSAGYGSGYAVFHGPELSAAIYKPLGEKGLGGYLTATVLPVVFWEYNEDEYDVDDDDGNTLGYSFDFGLSYVYNRVNFAAGYKTFILQPDEGNEGPRAHIDEDFSGLYIQAGASF